jgi:hypothetical protein
MREIKMNDKELAKLGMTFNFDAEVVEAAQRTSYWKPQDGKNQIRLVPGTTGKAVVAVKDHYFSQGSKWVSFVCPTQHGDKCQACEYGWKLWKAGLNDESSLYRAKTSYLAVVVDRADDTQTPKVWRISFSQWEKSLKGQLEAVRSAGGEALHPVNGYDLVVTKSKGPKGFAEYTMVVMRKSTPLAPTIEGLKSIMESVPDLASMTKAPADVESKYAAIEAIMPVSYLGDGGFVAKDDGGFSASAVEPSPVNDVLALPAGDEDNDLPF